MRFLVRSWNLYHGRTHPPSADLHLEQMVRVVTADAPDAVALQEVPLWAVRRLEAWSGMSVSWAMTMPALLGPLARRVTDRDPKRFRSSFTGQANALLVNPHLEAGRHRRVVLNPGLSRSDWLVRGGQRRVCHALELDTPGGRLVVANLHASNSPDRRLVGAEIQRAAAFLAGAERCVLCGDFNVRRHTVPGFTEPIGGIDQILVRGLDLERGPEAWAEERRTVDGVVLSDHAPVEAVVRVDLIAVRRGLPVLERYAYLNAGTFGPLPSATVEAMQEVEGRELREGRASHAYFERIMAEREELRERLAALVGAPADCVALTASTTEGCNIVVSGLGIGPGDEVVTTDSEHPGLFGGLVASGAAIRAAAIRDRPAGDALAALEAELSPRTKLIALSHVSWLTGAVLPIRDLSGRGVPVLADGAQAAGTIPVDVAELGCDFYTVSAQKWLLGPAATGCLYVQGDRFGELSVTAPSYLSWQLPEYELVDSAQRYEGGWSPAASVAGLLASLAFAAEAGEDRFARAREIAARCRELLAERGADVVTEPDQATLVSFRAPDPPALVERLAADGVIVRDLPGTGLVRTSCGFWTSEDDLERLAAGLP